MSSNSSARVPVVKPSVAAPPVKAPPPPPPPPVKAPTQPEVALYLAICPFETEEEGEIALSKGDLVEVIQEADNGWWLIKKGGEQGWAPSNYLQLEPRAPAAPSRPAARPSPAVSTSTPQSSGTRSPSIGLGLKVADSSSAPVAVMPGMGHVNGLAGILAAKRAAAAGQTGESQQSPTNSPTPSFKAGSKGAPPPPPPKPKPPTLAPKPSAVGGGPPPPVLSSKPNARPGGSPGLGQMDLAAALAKRAGRTG